MDISTKLATYATLIEGLNSARNLKEPQRDYQNYDSEYYNVKTAFNLDVAVRGCGLRLNAPRLENFDIIYGGDTFWWPMHRVHE